MVHELLKKFLKSAVVVYLMLVPIIHVQVLSQKKSQVEKPEFFRIGDMYGLLGMNDDGGNHAFGIIYHGYGLEYGSKPSNKEKYLSALYAIVPSSNTQVLSVYVKGGFAWAEYASSSGTTLTAYDYRYKPMAGFGCFIYVIRNASIGIGWSTVNGPFASIGLSLTGAPPR